MILAYLLATLIGLSLGLLGGGGSILTVPILVYVVKMDPKTSIALSLAIVGATSLIGSIGHYRKGNINLKVALIFAPFAMVGTFGGAKLSVFMSGATQLILFAIIMLIASFFMFKGRKESEIDENKKVNYILIAAQAIFVGVVTGIVGVGGGFIIVPALVLLANIRMKEAVGTSLFIIALNSISGFLGYLNLVEVPWEFLGVFIIFASIGIIVGSNLIQYVSQAKLKKAFAIFLVVMGFFILYKNKNKFYTSIQETNLETVTRSIA